MPLLNALTELAALNVAGIVRNYGHASVPIRVNRAALPCLLVLPLDADSAALRGDGLHTVAFANGPRTLTCTIKHLLLVAPQAQAILRQHLPPLVTLIDAYYAALAANVTLSDTLQLPPQIKCDVGVVRYGGESFFGAAFVHTWVLAL
jgi:hypothetical protein